MAGSLLFGPRMLYAMAGQNQLPRVFARTHPRFHTPHVAILLTAAAGLALAVSGTFVHVLSLSVIARLSTYAATAAALPVFRRREAAHPASFRVPAGGLVVGVTLAGCAWLLAQSGTRELRDVAFGLAAGLGLYTLQRGWRVRASR
jgi:amino acid transporter